MPFSLFNSFRLVAYLTHQAVQSMGSTSQFWVVVITHQAMNISEESVEW